MLRSKREPEQKLHAAQMQLYSRMSYDECSTAHVQKASALTNHAPARAPRSVASTVCAAADW